VSVVMTVRYPEDVTGHDLRTPRERSHTRVDAVRECPISLTKNVHAQAIRRPAGGGA